MLIQHELLWFRAMGAGFCEIVEEGILSLTINALLRHIWSLLWAEEPFCWKLIRINIEHELKAARISDRGDAFMLFFNKLGWMRAAAALFLYIIEQWAWLFAFYALYSHKRSFLWAE